MKSIRFYQYGGPEVLILDELDEPKPGSDSVLIEVKACAVNHFDLDIRDGSSRLQISLPHTLGMDYAGEVIEVGAEVTGVKVGDRVTALHQFSCGDCVKCLSNQEEYCRQMKVIGVHLSGGYSTHAIVPSRAVVKLQSNLNYDSAAAAQTTFSTAWHALNTRAKLQVGETVLVNAVGGGVGSAALQVALVLGGRVLVSAGSKEKLDRAIEMGAEAGVNYRTHDLKKEILDLTDGRGVDVVMESVGGEVLAKSIEVIGQNGRVVTVRAHAGEMVQVDVVSLFRRQASLVGGGSTTAAEIKHVLNLVSAGVFEVDIHRRFPLEAAGEAHQVIAERSNYGKLLLVP